MLIQMLALIKLSSICSIDLLVAAVEEEKAESAVDEEQGKDKSLHVLGTEDIRRKQRLSSDPALNIYCRGQEENSNDKSHIYIWRPPSVGCMASIGESKEYKSKSRNNGTYS